MRTCEARSSELYAVGTFRHYGGSSARTMSPLNVRSRQAERLRCCLGATYVELRHVDRKIEGLTTKQHKVTMILDLTLDVERQWRAFNAKLRNQIDP